MSSNPEPAVIKECPTPNELRALLDGTMPEEIATSLQRHVDQCRTCQKALETLTVGGESWVGVVQELKHPAGAGSEHHLQEAMSRMKSDDSGTGKHASPDAPTRLEFLSPSDQPGSLGKLGNYEISEVVGQGGMGVVLKAFDSSLHRVVAVKILASHLAHHATARKRFIREAQAAAAVCHENVVTIHAIDEAGPQPKIVMHFVSGGSLQERLDQEGPFELKEILRIGMQTAAGLAAAHAQGLVHRDVKPANILLENGVQRVKLTDFGLARVVDDASLTLSGVIAGTPQYMAPEQAWGKVVDHRADLFGLGAVMYAMCVGHSPFRARSTMAVLKRVCEEEPRPIAAINPDIPDWFCRIISKLLAKQPNDRFQTATEVSDLLAQCLTHVQQPMLVPLPKACASLAPAATAVAIKPAAQVINEPESAAAQAASVRSSPAIEALPARCRIPFHWGLMPVLMTVLALIGFAMLFEWPPGPPNSYFGFNAIMIVIVALPWCVFYLAWQTEDWRLRLGCLVALAVGAIYMVGSMREGGQASFIVSTLAAMALIFMLVYVAALLLVRPWLTGTWQRRLGLPYVNMDSVTPVPKSPWYRTGRLILTSILLVPVVFVGVLVASFVPYQARRQQVAEQALLAEMRSHEAETVRQLLANRQNQAAEQDPQVPIAPSSGFTDPFAPQEKANPATAGSEGIKKLMGRWVVLSVQGPEPPLSASQVYGAAGAGMMAPGMPSLPPGAMPGMGMEMSRSTESSSPQWIEITDRQFKLVSSREVMFDFGLREGRELSLRDRQSKIASDVRTGIFLRDGDRLVICWGPGNQPAPQELKASDVYQLMVCRREWSADEPRTPVPGVTALPGVPSPGTTDQFQELPPLDGDASPSTRPVPRADMPFTPHEAKAYQEAWAKKLKVQAEITNSIGMRLRLIPPGNIRRRNEAPAGASSGSMSGASMMPMGSSGAPAASSRQDTTRPGVLAPIYVGVHEVTRGQFRKFVDETHYVTGREQAQDKTAPKQPTWRDPQIDQDSDDHPVVYVDSHDAIAFTQWLSRTEKKTYRVVSSDEWEFVMRAGSTAEITLGTDKLKHRSQFFTTTAPVGSYSRNPFGLYDLIGNSAEWTWGTQLVTDPRYDNGGFLDGSPSGTPMGRFVPLIRKPGFTLLGGDFATRIEASQPGMQFALVPGIRVAMDLTEASLLPQYDDLEQLSDVDYFNMQAVWCDIKIVQPNAEPKTSRQLVVAIYDRIPQDEVPYAVGWHDLEIERGVMPGTPYGSPDDTAEGFRNRLRAVNWSPISVPAAVKWLEQVEFETDSIPAHLANPVFAMPIPRTTDRKLVSLESNLDLKDLVANKCEYGHPQVFRFFDTTVDPTKEDAAYVYRYRLKYKMLGFDSPNFHVTPWKTSNSAVMITPMPQ